MIGQSDVRLAFAELLEGMLPFDRCRAICEQEDGFSPAVWSAIAEGGWLEIGLADAGLPFAESIGVAEQSGKQLLPGPFTATATFVAPLIAATFPGLLEQAVRNEAIVVPIVPTLVYDDGELLVSLPNAVSRGGGLCLDETFMAVPHAHHATHLLVPVQDEEGVVALAIFDAQDAGLSICREPVLDLTAPTASVTFTSACSAAQATTREDGLRRDVLLATLRLLHLISAESIGGTEHVLRQTVEYVSGRMQFGVPVGSFQALKHTLADVHVACELGRGLLYDVGERLERDVEHAALDVLLTRLHTAESFSHACEVAIQCHGGAGFTWELGLHYWYRAALRHRATPVTTTDLRALLAATIPGRLGAVGEQVAVDHALSVVRIGEGIS